MDSMPDDMIGEIISWMNLNDVLKTWRLVSKDCYELVSWHYYQDPVKSFDENNGSMQLLPRVETSYNVEMVEKKR